MNGMPEPHSTTAGIIIGGSIGITGSLFGAEIDALLLGMFSAIFVSIWLPTVNNRVKAAAAVAMSSLMAGYGSPVAVAWVASDQAALAASGSPLRLLMAIAIGAACPTIVPLAIARLQTIVGGANK